MAAAFLLQPLQPHRLLQAASAWLQLEPAITPAHLWRRRDTPSLLELLFAEHFLFECRLYCLIRKRVANKWMFMAYVFEEVLLYLYRIFIAIKEI